MPSTTYEVTERPREIREVVFAGPKIYRAVLVSQDVQSLAVPKGAVEYYLSLSFRAVAEGGGRKIELESPGSFVSPTRPCPKKKGARIALDFSRCKQFESIYIE